MDETETEVAPPKLSPRTLLEMAAGRAALGLEPSVPSVPLPQEEPKVVTSEGKSEDKPRFKPKTSIEG